MLAWEEADKSDVSAEDKAAIEKAIADVNALLDETVVDIEAWTAAEENLENALAAADIIEDPDPTVIDNALTTILKGINKGVNMAYGVFQK